MRAQVNCVLLGDAAFLALTASLIDPAIKLAALSLQALRNGGLPHFGPSRMCRDRRAARRPTWCRVCWIRDNGRAVLATLDLAVEGARAGWFDAMVTAPLQKSTINDAGVAFSGHTEYLADMTGTAQVVMMLAGETEAGQAAAPPPCGWRWPPPICRSRMARRRSRARVWGAC